MKKCKIVLYVIIKSFLVPCVLLYLSNSSGIGPSQIAQAAANTSQTNGAHDLYANDPRLTLTAHETYAYDEDNPPPGGQLYGKYAYQDLAKSYSMEEIAESLHTSFDEQGRLTYTLGIGWGKNRYCEEQIYDWDDAAHTCRNIYYKANYYQTDIVPDASLYYINNRFLFDMGDYQFSEDGRLLSWLSYSRNLDYSKPNHWSNELFFDRGYQADYKDDKLMEELMCHDYSSTTHESGSWEYRVYQYNAQGDCILRVTTTQDEILLSCYEYDKAAGQVDEYVYRLKEDWTLTCEDGSEFLFHFRGDYLHGLPAVTKTAADKTTEKKLLYSKTPDMGQQHYLMPQDVEETLTEHKYVVQPGDCLWDIAYRHYGNGSYNEIIYRANRQLIGRDRNMILPGVRLYIPEVGIMGDIN